MVEEKNEARKAAAAAAAETPDEPEDTAPAAPVEQDSDFKVNCWKFLHAKTPNGQFFEIAIDSLIALNVFVFLLNTCTIITDHDVANRFLDTFEGD